MYNVAKQLILIDKLLCSFSTFQHVAVKHHTRADRINKLWSVKHWLLWVCVCLYFALLTSMQITPFLHHITSSPHFPTLSHNWYNFWKKVIEQKNVYLNFSNNLSETFLILRRIQQDIITNVHSSSCKVTIILVGFEWHLNFLDRVSKSTRVSNLMKIRPVGAELSHAHRQILHC